MIYFSIGSYGRYVPGTTFSKDNARTSFPGVAPGRDDEAIDRFAEKPDPTKAGIALLRSI